MRSRLPGTRLTLLTSSVDAEGKTRLGPIEPAQMMVGEEEQS